MFEEQTAPYDRITQILQSQARPPDANERFASLIARGGAGFLDSERQYQQDQLSNQMNILKVFEAQKAMGNRDAIALESKIKMFTGEDPDGMALIIQELNKDTKAHDPNSPQMYSAIADVARRIGYVSPNLEMEKQKQQLELQKTQAEINKLNKPPGPDLTADMKDFLMTQENPKYAEFLLEKKRKPMPASVTKLQNDLLGELNIAGTIKADMNAIVKAVDSGKLNLGMVENVISQTRQAIGKSSPNSRNYETFVNSLKKLRNDSLRLNKGTQTEGDAIRAWDEIMTNLTDEKFVSKRLKEVSLINDRAAAAKNIQIDQMRSEYNLDPIDTSALENAPAAILMDEQGKQSPSGVKFLGFE